MAFLQRRARRQCLDGLQGDRHGFLAGLRPAQVGIHLGKEFVYRRIGQGLIVLARLGLYLAAVIREHRIQILLPKF